MLLFLFSSSVAKLQTQSSSSFPWECPLLNQEVFLPASVCSWDKKSWREALLPFRIGYWSDLCPSGHQILLQGWLSKVAASMTSWHSSTGAISQSGPVGFIANTSKTSLLRLRLVHFQSAAEYAIHHTPNPGLVASWPAPFPSLVSRLSLAGRIVYVQEDVADALPKAVCNAGC